MIEVGDRITYYDGYTIVITDSDQCKLANDDSEVPGNIIKIERPDWHGII